MSLLSDRIRDSLVNHKDEAGRYDLRAVVSEVKPTLSPDETSHLLDDVLYQRAKQASTKSKDKLAKAAAKAKEPDLFTGMDVGYAIDIDGNYTKDADDLLELEFKRVIEIRRESLKKDHVKLDVLESAYGACAPIWREHPDWTFGQCKAELKRINKAAKKRRGGGKPS